jgi:tetratricopeptide (TPR) repeat protein/predicted Ser/Thr protein kinase
VEDERGRLEGLLEAVLDGEAVDWASAESSADAPEQEAVRQLKVLAGIAELHRSLSPDAADPAAPAGPEGKLGRWGRLELLERIGRGAFGEVFRAWDSKLDREVAVKLLHAGGTQPEGATVLREARLLARVRHPNVVTVYDADEIDGRVGLWMEFIHGRDLEEILGERKRLDGREVIRIGIELCRALSAVHEAGLLHRDVKAQNLMQTQDGRLVLMDFGTGWELQVPDLEVAAVGTPLYLPPEIFLGASATVQSDIYAAGVLLFHLLTGIYPVSGKTVEEVGGAHARGQRVGLASRAPGVDKALAAVIGRAIDRDPSKRFESARQMLDALEHVRRRAETPRRAALIAAGFAMAVLLVGGVAWLSRTEAPPSATAPLSFKARDWVLVAQFENRTGEKLFDGTMDYALGLELSNSRHVNVVTRERIGDALRLMKKPPNTPVDAPMAREVCLRDGQIRALVTGRVEKFGSRYVVSAELVDPESDATLAGFQEESGGPDDSLRAVHRLSDRLRGALGETPARIPGEDAGLAKVTTSSLRALELYSRADLLMQQPILGNQAAAEELLRQAVAEDPAFASAWIHLAFALANQKKPLAEVRTYAETALRLADTTTERERYFIRGSYYAMVRDWQKAIAAYEALLALYPDHYWAANNLPHLYDWSHSASLVEKGVRLESGIADSRPKSFFWNHMAASDYLDVMDDPSRAAPYLERASKLITPEVRENFPYDVAWLELVPFRENWLRGEIRVAATELDGVASKVDSLSGGLRDILAKQASFAYMTLGRLEAAARVAGNIEDPLLRNDVLAQVAFLRGNTAELRHRLQFRGDWRPRFSQPWNAVPTLIARENLQSLIRQFLSAKDAFFGDAVVPPGDGDLSRDALALRGEADLAAGRRTEGIRKVERALAIDGGPSFGTLFPDSYLGRESLASALMEQGDVSRAIEVLERRSERFRTACSYTTAAYWLRNRLQLARLYRRVGRIEDAKAVEAELSRLLAVADPDHPILLELHRLEGS